MMKFGSEQSSEGEDSTPSDDGFYPPNNPNDDTFPQPPNNDKNDPPVVVAPQPPKRTPTQPTPPSEPPRSPLPPINPPAPILPASDKWICVTHSYNSGINYVGYGKIEMMARSHAVQNCQARDEQCANDSLCEEQIDADSSAWFCETKNYNTNRTYSGLGRSELEAKYYATNECAINSPNNVRQCKSLSTISCSKVN